MKRIISILFCIVLSFGFSLYVYADEATEKNICYNKPVTVSTRYEFPQVYLHNVVDGKTYTRTSTDTQDLYGDNQWFRVDLCATYTVSEVLIDAVTPAGGVAKNIAIDVWSNGEWIRVGQKFNIKAEDYPLTFYFDEIDCSYIQVSTNEPTSEKAASSWFGLSEIQAYHTLNISESEKKKSLENVPNGKEEIPVPEKIDSLFLEQGSREDTAKYQAIDSDSLKLPESVYDRTVYSYYDVAFVQELYKDTDKTNSQVKLLEKNLNANKETAKSFENVKESINFKDSENSSNFFAKHWKLLLGAVLILFALIWISLIFVSVFKLRKVSSK